MDKIDLRILAHLQDDASGSHADLADAVHLSPSQCSRRIARLREAGVIRRQVTLLDEAHLGLGVEAYVTVTMASYAPETVAGFHARIAALEAVVDCCALTGDADYLLRIVATDLQAFTRVLNAEILGHGDVASLRSSIVLDRIKRTTALPLPQPD